MAAHIITALGQLAQELGDGFAPNEPNWSSLDTALNLSCWTEDLDYDDYIDLRSAVDAADAWWLIELIEVIAYKYLHRWAERGFPANREEWTNVCKE